MGDDGGEAATRKGTATLCSYFVQCCCVAIRCVAICIFVLSWLIVSGLDLGVFLFYIIVLCFYNRTNENLVGWMVESVVDRYILIVVLYAVWCD